MFFLLDKTALKNNYIYLRQIFKERSSPKTQKFFLSIPGEKKKKEGG
jgi:hypothetical protein